MKRYLVFWFPNYYPSGGWNDLLDDLSTLEAARNLVKARNKPDDLWFGDFQIVDVKLGMVVT